MSATVSTSGRRGESAALAGVRAVLRERRDRANGEDLAYRVYLTVMLTIIVIAPMVRAIVLGLADEIQDRPEPSTVTAFGAALSLVTLLVALAGAQTGPARASLPSLDLLFSSGLSRLRLLGRSIWGTFAWVASFGVVVGAVIVVGRGLAPGGDTSSFGIDPWLAVGICAAMTGVALLASAAMLCAQLGRVPRWAVVCGIAVVGGVGALAQLGWYAGTGAPSEVVRFEPWGVTAALALAPMADTGIAAADTGVGFGFGSFEGAFPVSGPMALFAGLYPLVAGLAAAVGAAALVERLRFDALRDQALRWDAVSALAFTGDPRGVTARLGSPVTIGRRWKLRLPHVMALPGLSIAVRDLHGVRRTPGRSLAALMVIGASGALLGTVFGSTLADAPSPVVGGIVGAAVVLAVYAAIGPWSRGLRAAAEGVGSSPLLPFAPGRVLAWHLVTPALLALLTLGSVAALAGGALGLGAAACTVVVVLLLRLSGSLKGTIPQRLLAPVPTPAGDMSAVNVLVWTLDGVIAAVCVGGVLGALCAAALGGFVPMGMLLIAVGIALGVLGIAAAVRLSGAGG